MSRTKRRPPKPAAQPVAPNPGVEVMTTSWMLALLTSIGCELLAAGCRFYVAMFDPQSLGIAIFAGVVTIAALVAGTITLVLTVVVLKLRPTPPPRLIVATAVIVGLIPWLAAAALMTATKS